MTIQSILYILSIQSNYYLSVIIEDYRPSKRKDWLTFPLSDEITPNVPTLTERRGILSYSQRDIKKSKEARVDSAATLFN